VAGFDNRLGLVPQVRAPVLGANLGRVAGSPTHCVLCDMWDAEASRSDALPPGWFLVVY